MADPCAPLPRVRSRRIAAIALVALLVAVACTSDDDAADDVPPSTTTEAPTTTVESTNTTTAAPAPYPDHVSEQYAGLDAWICHPDLDEDVCTELSTTVIEPDGTATVIPAEPASDPAFDCFYVYPTTSGDPGPSSDLDVDGSEISTVRAQAARFATECRVFAPAYRQVTVPALLGGGATAEAWGTAYGDVVDAWRSYVTDAGEDRSVVLIGHSQGAGHLRRLIEDEITPTPALRDRVASAVLLGSAVPADGFDGLPPCASADDSGCVLSWAAYPAEEPPVSGAIFGRGTGEAALCTDPTALLERDEPAEVVVPTQSSLLGGGGGFDDVDTPFVTLPASVQLSCTEADGYGYLSVALAGEPGDVRSLDFLVAQALGPTWGLHLLDAQLAQDQLIELVSRQAEAHARR